MNYDEREVDDDGFIDLGVLPSLPSSSILAFGEENQQKEESDNGAYGVDFKELNPDEIADLIATLQESHPKNTNNKKEEIVFDEEDLQLLSELNSLNDRLKKIVSLNSANVLPQQKEITSKMKESPLPIPPPVFPSKSSSLVIQNSLHSNETTTPQPKTAKTTSTNWKPKPTATSSSSFDDPVTILREIEAEERRREVEVLEGGCLRSFSDLPSDEDEEDIGGDDGFKDILFNGGLKIKKERRVELLVKAIREKDDEVHGGEMSTTFDDDGFGRIESITDFENIKEENNDNGELQKVKSFAINSIKTTATTKINNLEQNNKNHDKHLPPIQTWTITQLTSYLESTQKITAKLLANIQENEIDGSVAIELDASGWKELGFSGIQSAKVIAGLKKVVAVGAAEEIKKEEVGNEKDDDGEDVITDPEQYNKLNLQPEDEKTTIARENLLNRLGSTGDDMRKNFQEYLTKYSTITSSSSSATSEILVGGSQANGNALTPTGGATVATSDTDAYMPSYLQKKKEKKNEWKKKSNG